MANRVVLILDEGARRSRRVLVNSQRFTIGRAADNDLVVDAPRVADRHATVSAFLGVTCVNDCGSRARTTKARRAQPRAQARTRARRRVLPPWSRTLWKGRARRRMRVRQVLRPRGVKRTLRPRGVRRALRQRSGVEATDRIRAAAMRVR